MKPWKLQEMNYKQVLETPVNVAVLPMSSTETHNLHLPFGTDYYQIEGIVDLACEKAAAAGAKVIRLPGIPYGVQGNLQKFKLTINVNQATLNQMIADIVRSLENHGVEKLVILNGHGGNSFQACVRDLYEQTDLFLVVIDWWKIGQDQHDAIFERPGEHADEMETSVCLHLAPELVHLEQADEGKVKASRFDALNEKWAWTPRPWERLTTVSGHGDPRLATPEKGKKYVDLIVDRLSHFLIQLSEEEIDESFPFVTGDG